MLLEISEDSNEYTEEGQLGVVCVLEHLLPLFDFIHYKHPDKQPFGIAGKHLPCLTYSFIYLALYNSFANAAPSDMFMTNVFLIFSSMYIVEMYA